MLAVLGILLLVAGAIVAFAVDVTVGGVDLQVLGYILIAGGGLALVAAVIKGAGWMSMSNSEMRTERHVSDDGRHRVEETQTR